MWRLFVGILLCGSTVACSKKTVAQEPTCIDEKLVSNMFDSVRQRGKWRIDGPMLWGYFFVDRERSRLVAAQAELERRGYHFVEILEPDQERAGFVLHVERVEVHSIDSLNARNRDLCALARTLNINAYDGMDVGPTQQPEAQ